MGIARVFCPHLTVPTCPTPSLTVKGGRVEQSNVDSYRVLRMNEAPHVETHVVRSYESPGGIGEPETCCVMPAIANAIFAATGTRLRRLPVNPELLNQA